MSTDPRVAITAADTALGIEFGSTRIKAVLIGPDHQVLATGGHGWENHLEGGLWSYRLDEVVAGLQSAYASLVADVRERYDVTPHVLRLDRNLRDDAWLPRVRRGR